MKYIFLFIILCCGCSQIPQERNVSDLPDGNYIVRDKVLFTLKDKIATVEGESNILRRVDLPDGKYYKQGNEIMPLIEIRIQLEEKGK